MAYKDPKKRFCFVYKTTNLINQKYYIGCHCTYKLDDGYLGSGMRIRRSIKKYGKQNFKLEVLEFFESREEALAREKELITEEILKDPLNMNIHPGGLGGGGFALMSIEKRREANKRGAQTQLKKRWSNPASHQAQSQLMTKLLTSGKIKRIDWTGKKHSNQTKDKIRSSVLGKQSGSMNSQFGSCWITKDKQSMKIRKDDIQSYLDLGWQLGRKMKQ